MRGRNRPTSLLPSQDSEREGLEDAQPADEEAQAFSTNQTPSGASQLGSFLLSVALLGFLVVLIGLLQDPRPTHHQGGSDVQLTSAPIVGSCGPLDRDLLQRHAVNNTLLVAFADAGMLELFGATWVHHLRRSGISYWLLAAADEEAAQAALRAGVTQCFVLQPAPAAAAPESSTLAGGGSEWGSPAWRVATWRKLAAVQAVQQHGFAVLHSDLDVVWLRDPLSYLSRFPTPDVFVSVDPVTTANAVGDDGLELGVTVKNYMNTGVFYVRHTLGGVTLLDHWEVAQAVMQRRGLHDQDGLYRYLEEAQPAEVVDRARRVTRVMNGSVALAQLPATLFQNSYSHTINKLHQVYQLSPYAVHFVWVWGHNAGKVHRMRESGYYADPPPYYSQGQFLTVDLQHITVPAGYNDWTDTAKMVDFHLVSMQAQLDQLYFAFALAHLLDRILILPKLKCFCIQNWFEAPQCRLPGDTHTRFPLVCPADFFLNMTALQALAPGDRSLGTREHSFLDNERMPAAVREDVVEVRPLGTGSAALPSGAAVVVTLPQKLGGAALAQALRRHQPARIMRFTAPTQSLDVWRGGGAGAAARAEFDQAMAGLAVEWCCHPAASAKAAADRVLRIAPPRQAKPTAAGEGAGAGGLVGVATAAASV